MSGQVAGDDKEGDGQDDEVVQSGEHLLYDNESRGRGIGKDAADGGGQNHEAHGYADQQKQEEQNDDDHWAPSPFLPVPRTFSTRLKR